MIQWAKCISQRNSIIASRDVICGREQQGGCQNQWGNLVNGLHVHVDQASLIYSCLWQYCVFKIFVCWAWPARPPATPVYGFGVLPRIKQRASRWAWFGLSLWPHQSFWFQHQRNRAMDGMGGRYAERAWGEHWTFCVISAQGVIWLPTSCIWLSQGVKDSNFF